jgi:hypothetical protein
MYRKTVILVLVAIFTVAVSVVEAQVQNVSPTLPESGSSSPYVLASAGRDQVRFATLGTIQKMRLQVLNQAGDAVYDSQFSSGSILDWKVDDGEGNTLPDGLYGCVVTMEDFTGKSSRRRAIFAVKGGAPLLSEPGRSALEVAAGIEGDTVAVMREEEGLPITHLAHDGKVGRVVSGKGGLSFRVGDMFAGRDVEHMRLTADGRLGIGVEEPAAKLDVAGLVRTSEGILFPDGTIQRTAANSMVLSARPAAENLRILDPGNLSASSSSAGTRSVGSAGFRLNALIKPGMPALTAGDQSFTGRLCLGQDCTDPETWSGSASENFRLKQNNNRLTLIDTSPGGYAQGDWQLRANSSAASGANFFAVDWLGTSATTATETPVSTPFLIEGAAPTNAFYINQNGNVGVGINVPERRMHVAETSSATIRGVAFDQYSADAFASIFILRKSRNATPGSHTILQSGDALFNFTGQGSDGTKFVDTARIRMEVDGVPGVSSMPGRMTFWTTPTGSISTTERMRIDSTGNVGIGTAAPTEKLHVAGNIRFTGSLVNSAPSELVPDYVFEPGYTLMSIKDLASFLAKEKHLPNVPSAAEIKENGLNFGEFQMRLLEKMEELTLYTVQQAKDIESKNSEIVALKSRNEALDSRLAAVERLLEQISKQEQGQKK